MSDETSRDETSRERNIHGMKLKWDETSNTRCKQMNHSRFALRAIAVKCDGGVYRVDVDLLSFITDIQTVITDIQTVNYYSKNHC